MLKVNTQFQYKNLSNDFKLNISVTTSSTGITGIYGPSGSGKTTLFKIISGLIRGTKEVITLNNEVICNYKTNKWTPSHKRNFGYVFQDTRLFPHLNVKKNLTFAQKINKNKNYKKISLNKIIDSLGLEELLFKKTHHLSGGQKKLIAIGRALMMDPKVLLLDEPLAGIDHERKKNIISFLNDLSINSNIPILYISHDLNEIKKLANWVITLKSGKVSKFGSIEQVTEEIDLSNIKQGKETKIILTANIINHSESNNLTILKIGEQNLYIPLIEQKINTLVKIEIKPQDVGIAIRKPRDVSFLNILSGKITTIVKNEKNMFVHLKINLGSEQKPKYIWSQITKVAEEKLRVQVGHSIFVLFKTMSIKVNNTNARKIINAY